MRRLRLALLSLIAAGALATAVLVIDGLTDNIAKCDVAIVLGSKVELDGTPSARLKARLDRAADLYADGLFPWIIVSGGTGKEGFDEAAVMSAYLVSRGVPQTAILADPQGVNTQATAVNSAALMKAHDLKSAMAVTQYFHIPRTRMTLKTAGIEPVYTAHAKHFELRDLYSTPREVVGYAVYWLRSR